MKYPNKPKAFLISLLVSAFLIIVISYINYRFLQLLMENKVDGSLYLNSFLSIWCSALFVLLGFLLLLILLAFFDWLWRQARSLLKSSNNKANELLNTKIKRIAIELFGYEFNHNSSDFDQADKSFVGRNDIIHRLEVLLTRSMSKSGAYLITGFRGMGKTSLISQVLYKIKHKRFKRIVKYARMFTYLILFALLNPLDYFGSGNMPQSPAKLLLFYLPITFLFFSLVYILREDVQLRSMGNKNLGLLIGHYWKSFYRVLTRNQNNNNHLLVLTSDFIIISITHLSVTILLLQIVPYLSGQDVLTQVGFIDLIIIYFTIFFLITLFVKSVDKVYLFFNIDYRERPKRLKWHNILIHLSRIFTRKLKYYFNYSHRIHIKINLSKDNLKDVDILRMIAREMLKKYKRIKTPFFTLQSMLGSLGLLLLTIIAVGIIYYNGTIYDSINKTKAKIGINQYFPSQALFPWNQSAYDQTVSKVLTNEGSFYDDEFVRKINEYLRLNNKTFKSDKSDSIASSLGTNDWIKILSQEADMVTFYLYQKTVESLGKSKLIRGDWEYIASPRKQVFFLDSSSKLIDSLRNQNRVFLLKKDSIWSLQFSDSSSGKFTIPIRMNFTDESFGDSISLRVWKKKSKLYLTSKEDQNLNSIPLANRFELTNQKKSRQWNWSDNLAKNINLSDDFKIIPKSLDYLFVIIIIFTILFLRFFSRYLRNFGVYTHSYIYSRLKRLNHRIKSSVTDEKTHRFTFSLSSILSGQRRHYPIADEKEIESEILSILEEIDQIPRAFVKPEFIFIFDELDKISGRFNHSIQDKEDTDPSFDRLAHQQSTRQRQEMVYKILANLKVFFTSSKAKFIFIAGREMYDSILADISDRESNLDSIFHETLYVNSFFYDSYLQRKDITGLTEEFVCQFILPHNSPFPRSIEGYYQYLQKEFRPNGSNFKIEMASELMFQKVILTLKNFILYLTYRSNGAPKRLIKLFEQFIICPNLDEDVRYGPLNHDTDIVIGQNKQNLYLMFGFHNQYKFGHIANLFSPNIFSESLSVKHLGDKLMIAISFLTDHLYKFHGNAFSWQHLELTPDIISVNRAPQLRGFIQDLIDSLAIKNLRTIVSGLFEYKFNSKVAKEIMYISSVSESEAAAFNFTLDESLQTKRHYQNILKRISKQKVEEGFDHRTYHHAESFVLMTIGDLHYYDQEYDDAIMFYLQATQSFRIMEPEKIPIEQLIIYIRNMLKLGLAMEKKKTLDSAYTTYHKLTNLVIGLRHVALSDLEIHQSIILETNIDDFCEKFVAQLAVNRFLKFEYYRKNKEETPQEKLEFSQITETLKIFFQELDEVIFYGRIYEENSPEKYGSFVNYNQIDHFLGFKKEFFHEINALPDSRKKSELLFKTTQLEGFRILYQPLLAKLQLIEKSNLGGITLIDYKRSLKEFNYMIQAINLKEKFLIQAEFFNKVGDILFYKNGYLFGYYDETKSGTKRTTELKANYPYKRPMTNSQIIRDKYGLVSEEPPKYYKPAIGAYEQYIKSLFVIVKGLMTPTELTFLPLKTIDYGRQEKALIGKVLNFLASTELEREFPFRGEDATKSLANVLSDTGDALLCLVSDQENSLRSCFLKKLVELDKTKPTWNEILPLVDQASKLELALVYYLTSGYFYSKSGKLTEDSFQLTKILYSFKEHLSSSPNTENFEGIWKQLEEFIGHIYSLIYRAQEGARTPEANRMSYLTHNNGQQKNDSTWALSNTPLAIENKELYILALEIAQQILNTWEIDLSRYSLLANPYQGLGSMFIRIKELRYKSKMNFLIYSKKAETNRKIPKDRKTNQNQIETIEAAQDIQETSENKINLDIDPDLDKVLTEDQLIYDSIYSCYEIINHLKVFGVSYLFNYSFLAKTHKKLAWWIDQLNNSHQPNLDEKLGKVREKLKQDLGVVDFNTMSAEYHYDLALKYFKQSIQMHNEGSAYKQQIRKMFYLDDDYNDNLYHFCAAIERFKINTGQIQKEISALVESE